jgi:flagellar biosynthesis repressor protein FlbT
MALKLSVKPGDHVHVGSTRITIVSDSTCVMIVEGDAPVLRAEEAMVPDRVQTTLDALHLVLQDMYLGGDIAKHQKRYFELTQARLASDPEMADWVAQTNCYLIEGRVYKAVKAASKLTRANFGAPAPRAMQRISA